MQDPQRALSTAVTSPAGVGDVLRSDDLMLYEQQLVERLDRGETPSDEEMAHLEMLRRGDTQPQSELEQEEKEELKSELITIIETISGYDEVPEQVLDAEQEEEPGSALAPWPENIPWRAIRPLPAGDHYSERVLRTHRLPSEVAEALDAVEELCKSRLRLRINLSDLVASALTLAIQDVAEQGVHSPLLRTLLGPLYQQLGGSLPQLKAELKSIPQTNLTSELKSSLLIDSNHPSGIKLINQERDDSSRLETSTPELKSKLNSAKPVPLPSATEVSRWRAFIEDFGREIPGDPKHNQAATAHQLEQIRRRSGLSLEEFAAALYEARDRYRSEGNKTKLRNPWAFFIDRLQLLVGEK